jgi:3-oxoacyl-[acyl-carrier protein] reductase
MNISLRGKHALVCGASRGIGRATAEELAAADAEITLVARNKALLKEVADSLPVEAGQLHRYLVADFTDPQHLEQAVTGLVARHPVQILVNNTGGPPAGAAHLAGTEEYNEAFKRHVICNQVLVGCVLEGMRKSHYGRVINIISTSVKIPIAGLGVSNTIRGAVASWAKTLANELGPDGITVNNILPGFTETTRLDAVIHSRAAAMGVSEQTAADAMRKSVPLRRFGRPTEVAQAVLFLASEAASYINGINLPVDGGRTGTL